MFVVDAGDLSWKSKTLAANRLPQQREKARVQHQALMAGGMDGMVPGDGDLALGSSWLAEQAEASKLPYVAANLLCDGAPLFPGARRVEKGGVSLVIAGVLQEGTTVGGCVAGDPVEGLRSALAGMGEADLLVVLSHEDPSLDEALAEAIPEIDLVVNGGVGAQYNTPNSLPGQALQLAAGSRGKKVGVARIELQPGGSGFLLDNERAVLAERIYRAERRLVFAKERVAKAQGEKDELAVERAQNHVDHYQTQLDELKTSLASATSPEEVVHHSLANELVNLGEEVADDPAILAIMEAGKGDIEAAAQAGARLEAYKGPYVGSAACAACHVEPTTQWQGTAHASAWATLQADQRDQDLDCFSCHVTGALDPQGPQHPSQVTGLENVGCESCHGPGRDHASNPAKGDMVGEPAEAVCTSCHDGQKDEGRFDLPTYLPKVRHSAGGAP